MGVVLVGKRLFLSTLIILVILWPTAALGQQGDSLKDVERIESFSSRIAILPEGGIEVTETIIMVSHGESDGWGLERMLPRWQGRDLEQASEIEILEVLLDGAPAGYELTETEQGRKVSAGI